MKVGFVQINTTVGALEENARAVRDGVVAAALQGAELVIAPELALPGYPPRDLLLVSSFVPACEAVLTELASAVPPEVTVVLGTVWSPEGADAAGHVPRQDAVSERRPRRPLFNAAVVLRGGRVVGRFPKTLLPTYDVFDERRYFEPGLRPEQAIVEVGGVRVGIVICEDGWNDALFWPNRRYDIDPIEKLAAHGAELIVNLSASPFAAGKSALRRRMFAHAAARHGVGLAFVNLVGGNDGLIFDGGSCLFAPGGRLVAECASFQEQIAVFEADLQRREPSTEAASDTAFGSAPPGWDAEEVRHALVLGIRDYFRKVSAKEAVIGLSGGIDSALVATLAVEALGPSNVTGVAMPSRYSSDHSVRDALDLADRLEIPCPIVPIAPAFDGYQAQLQSLLSARPASPGYKDLTEENLQSRVRGATLMAFSNRTGAIVLTTGNKSECAVGYCTLYGDTCGGLAVIADLFKIEVYALSRHLNAVAEAAGRRAPIPESTLTKPPSAELRPGQLDQDDLPPYDTLDRILEALIERELGVDDATAVTGEPRAIVADIARRVRNNEYKRRQFAPTLRVSDRAWVGRDYPIAQRFCG